ncbi:hypothetical protein B0H16DRAFT_1477635 [Mycena metata]|uniref:Uncharacterized protein n=1 Tax=Mycena metata TaxID=1033252 RepID=A0AAD7H8K8_9AGAR|nr:hypothetical protein B0H16DRAFT_1477635 [Mycena metata]
MADELSATSRGGHTRWDVNSVKLGEQRELVPRQVFGHVTDRNDCGYTVLVSRQHILHIPAMALKLESILRLVPNHSSVTVNDILPEHGAGERSSSSAEIIDRDGLSVDSANARHSHSNQTNSEALEQQTKAARGGEYLQHRDAEDSTARPSRKRTLTARPTYSAHTRATRETGKEEPESIAGGFEAVGTVVLEEKCRSLTQHSFYVIGLFWTPLRPFDEVRVSSFQRAMSIEQEEQANDILKRFWIRVGELCSSGRDPVVCDIADDHPSCLTCRTKKLGCDRRARFLFEHTKDEFFSNFEDFKSAIASVPSQDVKLANRTNTKNRRTAFKALGGGGHGGKLCASPYVRSTDGVLVSSSASSSASSSSSSDSTPTASPLSLSLCLSCLRDFEKGKKVSKKKRANHHPAERGANRPWQTLLSAEDVQGAHFWQHEVTHVQMPDLRTELLRRMDSTRREILSLRCKIEDRLASVQEPEPHIEQLLDYTHYYESALTERSRYL